jgi:hypothetical protein
MLSKVLSLARKKCSAGRRLVEALVNLLRHEPLVYHVDVGPNGMMAWLFFHDEAIHLPFDADARSCIKDKYVIYFLNVVGVMATLR